MSHDLSLGPPVDVGVDPEAKHRGPCFDGVYGCHLCWNAANDGKGTITECESYCRKEKLTRIVRMFDSPELYACCEECDARRHREFEAEAESLLSDEEYFGPEWAEEDE